MVIHKCTQSNVFQTKLMEKHTHHERIQRQRQKHMHGNALPLNTDFEAIKKPESGELRE